MPCACGGCTRRWRSEGRVYRPFNHPKLFFKPMQLPVWPSFTTAVRRGLNQCLRLWENTAFTCVGRRCVLGNSLGGIKGDFTVSGSHGIGRVFGLDKPIVESRRADLRTAFLSITSVRSMVAEGCRDLQTPHRQQVLCSLPCPLLQSIAP